MPPSDYSSECNVQAAEAKRQEAIAPSSRQKQRDGAERHKAQAHNRYNADRKCSARDHGRAVEQEPQPGQYGNETGLIQHCGEKSAGE